jgi:hypothetical protein
MLLRTCLALLVAAGAWAQPPNPTANRNSPPTRGSFTAKGLKREQDLTDLFVGNFADVSVDRGSLAFSLLFKVYLEAYSRYCFDFLPPNKVEMTELQCADPPAPIRLPSDGPPPQPHGCLTWKKVSLGWARPDLYAAFGQFDIQQKANQYKDMFGSLKNLNPTRMLVGAGEFESDTEAMVRLNACGGPGLKRFEDNVVLFSMGKQPLLLPGEPPPGPKVLSAGALADSDFKRLLEDLIADQARTWMANRYLPGSTSQMIVAHDPTGRPSMIRAKYLFTSPLTSGRTQGSVNVSFTDGMPACIYFSDAPSTCQTPDRRLVSKFAAGGYLDPNASPPAPSSSAAAPVQPAPNRDAAARAKSQAEAPAQISICVPGDLDLEWDNPPAGGKMEAFQRELKANLREWVKLPQADHTKWMTVDARLYSTWNAAVPVRSVATFIDGGRCLVGRHDFLKLSP